MGKVSLLAIKLTKRECYKHHMTLILSLYARNTKSKFYCYQLDYSRTTYNHCMTLMLRLSDRNTMRVNFTATNSQVEY